MNAMQNMRARDAERCHCGRNEGNGKKKAAAAGRRRGGDIPSHETHPVQFLFIMLHFEGESFAMKSSRDE